MKNSFKYTLILFILIFILLFRVCTLRDNIKYNFSNTNHERNHTLTEYEVSASFLVVSNRKVIDFKLIPSIVPNIILKSISNYILFLVLIIFFRQPMFDLRKRIIQFIIFHLHGSKYKGYNLFS